MEQKPFSRKPGNVEAFLVGAEQNGSVVPRAAAETTAHPWLDGRADVMKIFNLRLPEPHLLMLRHIAAHTPDSMQVFCQKVLLPSIEAKIAELEASLK